MTYVLILLMGFISFNFEYSKIEKNSLCLSNCFASDPQYKISVMDNPAQGAA